MNGTTFMSRMHDLVNSNVTNRTVLSNCSLVFFYASWCPFSARAAPFVNRLATLYPDLEVMAVDSGKHHHVNAAYGIMSIPTLTFVHNGKGISRYNQSEYDLAKLRDFLAVVTEFEHEGPLHLEPSNFEGPLPCIEIPEPDYYLHLAWAFTIVVGLFFFGKSSFCRRISDSIRRTWNEATMHAHQD